VSRLLVVHHSQKGGRGAEALAAVLQGIADVGGAVECVARPALVAGVEDLLAADALLFVTPEYFGYMSGALKDFFDRTFYASNGRAAGKPYALLVVCGNDGSGAVRAVERIASGYPLKVAQPPLILREADFPAGLAQARELGATLAALLDAGLL
jgi:multimeric flavodoxin WrbA